MAFQVYLLRCGDGRFYAGHTDNLDARMAQHMAGKGCDYTARRQPVMLVWSESVATRIEALSFERQIKGWSRAKKEALIAGDWDLVSLLAAGGRTRASTGSARTEVNGGEREHPVRPEPVEGRAPRTHGGSIPTP